MEKKSFYISVARMEISQVKSASPYEFEIEATDEEIKTLREMFDAGLAADWQSFWRAHVPYLEYHHDQPNDEYDQDIAAAYRFIYEHGNPETKQHIEAMGILD